MSALSYFDPATNRYRYKLDGLDHDWNEVGSGVLMNLMLNGIEAMRESGGELTIASQDQNGEVLITIADVGVGLPAENVDQIFTAFFTTKPQGSGMGLAISRSIIEAHGGRLWASANSRGGATFQFTLPRASP